MKHTIEDNGKAINLEADEEEEFEEILLEEEDIQMEVEPRVQTLLPGCLNMFIHGRVKQRFPKI